MATNKEAFRPIITSDQIYAILDLMDSARRGDKLQGLDPALKSYYDKLRVQAFKIGDGIARPAYTISGKRKESAISLESLGSSVEEVAGFEGKYNNPAQMDDAVNDQLTWMINNPEVQSKDMPPIEEFMVGGKYYSGASQVVDNTNTGECEDIVIIPEDDGRDDEHYAKFLASGAEFGTGIDISKL